MYSLELESKALQNGKQSIEPLSMAEYTVGFCSRCQSQMKSLAYFFADDCWLVAASCPGCNTPNLLQYDRDWNWIKDMPLTLARRATRVSELPREQLEAVFTPAEIRDMLACEEGRPYVRQNLYRARAKFELFEEKFRFKIEL
ncbi:MAG: hypothetical protein GKC10_06395 [Methanosarcinales archaeon]|nr:hypothetical protein [Methanosarcinales archaeon]